MSILSYLKEFFMRPPMIVQFEQMLVEEEARRVRPTPTPLEPEVVAEAPVAVEEAATAEVVAAPVAEVLAVAPIAASVTPKRTKSAKGKFVADDKSTPDMNEAFVGGKTPTKKNTKRKKR